MPWLRHKESIHFCVNELACYHFRKWLAVCWYQSIPEPMLACGHRWLKIEDWIWLEIVVKLKDEIWLQNPHRHSKLYQIHFCEDNVIWNLSDFILRPTIGITADGYHIPHYSMIHMIAGVPFTQTLAQLGPVKHFRSGTNACVESLPPPNGYVLTYVRWFVCLSVSKSLRLTVYQSVCLSVCLLATSRKNGWTEFREIFRIGGNLYKKHSATFWGCSI